MTITVDEAAIVSQRYPDLPLIYLNPIEAKTKSGKDIHIVANSKFKVEDKSILKDADIYEINVLYTEPLYSKLISINSLKYRKPYGKKSFIDIDKILNEYKEINKKSKRKRYLISCSEQYFRNKSGRIIPILRFGENITYDRWQEVKPRIDKKKSLYFRYSENGIIVFVDLRPGGDDYLRRFYKNSDLVTSLVGRKSTDKIVIAPDFLGSADVISVDDPQKLLPEYSNGNWRLIIVGDTLSKDYAEALQMVKSYDPFVRFMMATNLDLTKKEEFIQQVKNQYTKDNWEIK
jgi:hypothetical protein